MTTEPTTPKPRKDKGLAGRLDKAFWRKHNVAAMTADEEHWPQREPSGNLGRIFVIILLFHVVLIASVVAYNIISPRTTPVSKSENGSTLASRIPPKPADVPVAAAALPPPSKPAVAAAPPSTDPAEKKSDGVESYEVRSGDNLPGIAAALGVSAEVLIKMNDLENTEMFPGRKIIYPKGEVPRAVPLSAPQLRPFPLPVNAAENVAKDEAKKEQEKKVEKIASDLPEVKPKVSSSDSPPPKPAKPASKAEERPPAPRPSVKTEKDSTPPKPKVEKKTEESKTESRIAKAQGKGEKSAKEAANKHSHVVAPKETLYSIARKYGVKVEALQKANGIKDPGLLRDGMRLVIPKKD